MQLANTFYWMNTEGQKKLWVTLMEPGVENNIVLALITTAADVVEADLHYFTSTRLMPSAVALFAAKLPDWNEVYLGVAVTNMGNAPVIHSYAKAATADDIRKAFYSGAENPANEFQRLITKIRDQFPNFKAMTVDLTIKKKE